MLSEPELFITYKRNRILEDIRIRGGMVKLSDMIGPVLRVAQTTNDEVEIRYAELAGGCYRKS